ncbi:hypothetical protein [Staphylococcus succinus]|uniref:hypothetical protein n=1 Tax=Staphylococcus succinus TaxID=61015 RepID=UPI000E676BD8|nr:hypothetical protein [Staphylococcus succinus]RIN23974.1 hypothetical protein BU067_10855 [Staphylococcus succinus]
MNIRDLKLKDNGLTTFGGLAHSEETLAEFMDDLKPNEKRTIEDINLALSECGILPINESNYPEIALLNQSEVVI